MAAEPLIINDVCELSQAVAGHIRIEHVYFDKAGGGFCTDYWRDPDLFDLMEPNHWAMVVEVMRTGKVASPKRFVELVRESVINRVPMTRGFGDAWVLHAEGVDYGIAALRAVGIDVEWLGK